MQHEQITLAPAAGSGIGKMIADNLLARPGIIEKMADTLDDAFTATRKVWVQTGKGEGYWDSEPDTRSRLQALFGALAHMEGEPVKRIIHQHLGGSGKAFDPVAVLQSDPTLMEAARRVVANAEHRTKKPARKTTPEVEAEVSFD